MDTMRPNEITVLPIPEGVTEITEKEAFPCRADLKCVQIPDGVVKIGDEAALKVVHVPDSVTEIESWAFDGCSALEEIHIPKSVTRIGDYAFARCPAQRV